MDKEKLLVLINEGKSIDELRVIFNKSYSSIRYWLKKFNIQTKWRGYIKSKYSDAEMLCIANQSDSLNQFILNLTGRESAGGAFYHYKKRLEKAGFDISSFKFNGGREAGGKKSGELANLKAIKQKKRLSRSCLKKFLDYHKVEYKCKECEINEWRGKKLHLPIHHKDEDCTNNAIENLEYLCPNCHIIEHYSVVS